MMSKKNFLGKFLLILKIKNTMYLKNIKLWNFRKFGDNGEYDINKPNLSLNFTKGLNVLIGENDSGKTAIIDAIKIVLKTHAYEWIKVEETDFNLEETALRETHEEVGVHPDKVKIIKTFSEIYIPPSNFLVAPFMGISHEELTFIPDLDEVKRVLEFSIVDFLDEKSITKVKMSTSYATDIEVPAFMVDKYVVWGATAMMMSELKETIKSVLR